MDEVKDKAKVLMKKLKNPFSSSSRFKGEGHRVGESQPAAAAASRNSNQQQQQQQQNEWRKNQQERWNAEQQRQSGKAQPSPRKPVPEVRSSKIPVEQPDPVVTRTRNDAGGSGLFSKTTQTMASLSLEDKEDLDIAVATFLSGGASTEAVQVIIRLLANIIKEPGLEKFRKVRMGNPKIQEAIGSTVGGVELLEFLGFMTVEDEQGEVWRVMDEPSPERLSLISEAITALGRHNSEPQVAGTTEPSSFDRQVKVFYVSADNTAARAELPADFYNLSLDEVKRLAAAKRKKLEDSQLLVPKSSREKQALAARQKHKVSVIRILFPDNVVLQGFFLPKEPTSAIYEFVKSSLKTQVGFKLVDPAASGKVIALDSDLSLDQADLVPTAMLRFQTDEVDFSGLRSDYLSRMEPLTPSPF